MMTKVKVYVTLRESVVDPQGSAATKALQKAGHSELKEVRIGKFIELSLDENTKNIEETVHTLCKNLLVNTEIEDYRFEIEEGDAK